MVEGEGGCVGSFGFEEDEFEDSIETKGKEVSFERREREGEREGEKSVFDSPSIRDLLSFQSRQLLERLGLLAGCMLKLESRSELGESRGEVLAAGERRGRRRNEVSSGGDETMERRAPHPEPLSDDRGDKIRWTCTH